jgi:hypothetical protein
MPGTMIARPARTTSGTKAPRRASGRTHTDWSPPQVLPTIAGHPWDTYLLPHVAPDGTVYTTVTNKPVSKGFLHNSIYLISSKDGGVTWQGPTLVVPSVLSPTYLNTTFSEGIVNSFGLGTKQVSGHWPLYVTTSVSTYDYGQNPSFYQQQIVARVALP